MGDVAGWGPEVTGDSLIAGASSLNAGNSCWESKNKGGLLNRAQDGELGPH